MNVKVQNNMIILFNLVATSFCEAFPDSIVHGANLVPTWSCRPQMGPMLAHKPCYQGYDDMYHCLVKIASEMDHKTQAAATMVVVSRTHWCG